jgi:hypothetical protein
LIINICFLENRGIDQLASFLVLYTFNHEPARPAGGCANMLPDPQYQNIGGIFNWRIHQTP